MEWCVPLCFHGLVCGIPYEASARSRETESGQARYRFNGLGRGVPSQLKFEIADRRDWGGRGDDPEESTQHMIERIWESLTDIRRRMDQQAPVPPVAVPPGDGETVPIAPVPLGVEVPFVAPLPPPPPVLITEEPVMQVENALVVGGTDTSSRHWSPASPSPVPHSSEPRPGSLEVPGMGLQPCGPQVVVFIWSSQLLDLFT
ncbi:hypothetical protein Taro_014978 [Colocasia esculenta]|uniref:Uncharacterized protein n=1 Tax=Colocasia esculenta TaxID=4460 RepID=A0A843UJM3_COLES|nr:hypothetical protein [Colocasia esculenta]